MGLFGKLFTWWDGATIGTLINSSRTGELVGTDHQGNRYFRSRKLVPAGQPNAGHERRWVLYNGANDASRVPAEWHGWLHGTYDGVPESRLPPPRSISGSRFRRCLSSYRRASRRCLMPRCWPEDSKSRHSR